MPLGDIKVVNLSEDLIIILSPWTLNCFRVVRAPLVRMPNVSNGIIEGELEPLEYIQPLIFYIYLTHAASYYGLNTQGQKCTA